LQIIAYDGDPGIDDSLAILMALNSPDTELLGITTVAGNSSLENTTRNALRILELAGRPEIPVARGASSPIAAPINLQPLFHGLDGLGDGNLPDPKIKPSPVSAEVQLAEQIREHGGDLTIVACGPLTNLATLLLKNPDILMDVRQVVVMGGAIACPGNITPFAEFNVYFDPEAANILFNSRAPITLVTLDVTSKAYFTWGMLNSWSVRNRRLLGMLQFYFNAYRMSRGMDACLIHDAVAMAVALDPNILVNSYLAYIDVETKGPLRGRTFASPAKSSSSSSDRRWIRVCEKVDLHRVYDTLRHALEF